MSEDLMLRAQIRREVVKELADLLNGEGAITADHVVCLSDYEAANLREALYAAGISSAYRSPLNVLNTGDWAAQVLHKLQGRAVAYKPNATAQELTQRATGWRA